MQLRLQDLMSAGNIHLSWFCVFYSVLMLSWFCVSCLDSLPSRVRSVSPVFFPLVCMFVSTCHLPYLTCVPPHLFLVSSSSSVYSVSDFLLVLVSLLLLLVWCSSWVPCVSQWSVFFGFWFLFLFATLFLVPGLILVCSRGFLHPTFVK